MYSLFCIPIFFGFIVAVTGGNERSVRSHYSLDGDNVRNPESHEEQTLCAYYKANFVKKYNQTATNFVDANNTEHCSKPTDSCFILWQDDPRNRSIVILHQGCWDSTDSNCKQSECIAYKKATKALNYTKFCCCSGNFCNSNVTEGYLKDSSESIEDPALEFVDHMSYTMQIVVIFVVVVVFAFLAAVTFFFARIYCSNPKRSNESLHLVDTPPPLSPNFDLDTLKIQEKAVGQGGFGSVYCGSLNDHNVAVKIFPSQNREYFLNEREIYNLPHMDHSSLPKYIGYKERLGEDGRREYLLVLSYCPLGCLQDFLRDRTIDFNQLCKMSLSITRGLAHLHTEIDKGGKFKHCIAHRDVTSRNILVKSDGSCVLCDFGFAVCVSGSKYFLNGVEQQAETYSLSEVGTYRYMAPELLDGAVNLRDLESSLKQIDMYALGLVMWEIASRCGDLYQGMEVPEYKLPFEAEVGPHITMDQMQNYVVKLKARPLFPEIWKATNPAVRSLKETIEDCWDQDAEARLTALCVEERLTELPVMWERYKAGLGSISPLLISTSNFHKSSSMIKKSSDDSALALDYFDSSDQLICPRERANSLSDCTTETLLSPSDTNGNQIYDKNNMISNSSPATIVNFPLQSYQGRNPCLARNLLQKQPDDLPVIGNILLDCSSKYHADGKFCSYSDGDSSFVTVPGVTESSLPLPSDLSYSNRICNPIPYVQNQVNSGNIPKKHNIPENKSSNDILNKEGKRWGPFYIFDKKKHGKNNTRAGLIGYLLDRKTSVSSCFLPEEQQPLKSAGICSPLSPSEADGKQGQTNPVTNFWSCDAKDDQYLRADGSLLTSKLHSDLSVKNTDTKNIPENYNSQFTREYETVINIMEKDNTIPQNPTSDQEKTVEKSKRPTTLPVQPLKDGLDNEDDLEISDFDISKEMTGDVKNNAENTNNPSVVKRRGSGNKRKGVKRVQTPFRLSLNDDRIMLSTGCTPNVVHTQFESAKFSASVPNMNTLCSSTQASSSIPQNRKQETELQEIPKSKPLNGLIVPVNINGHQNVFVV